MEPIEKLESSGLGNSATARVLFEKQQALAESLRLDELKKRREAAEAEGGESSHSPAFGDDAMDADLFGGGHSHGFWDEPEREAPAEEPAEAEGPAAEPDPAPPEPVPAPVPEPPPAPDPMPAPEAEPTPEPEAAPAPPAPPPPSAPLIVALPEPLPPRHRRPVEEPRAAALPSDLDALVSRLLQAPPGPLADRVRRTLAGFGARLLSQCRMFKVRVLVTDQDPSQVVPSLQGSVQYDGIGSGYFAADRLCYLHVERMDWGDEFGDPVALSFASAIDHAMGEETFASRHSPAVKASFRACQKSEPGHSFVDGWCSLSPQHYFAQAVAAWMTQPGGPLQADDSDPYCSRSRLYDLDRSMYGYLEYLLRETRSYG
ncbi:MAG TPA: hypothetical protein VGO93_20580 [Candidatus Xenobia bacterium]|jgi:hypothetical protein